MKMIHFIAVTDINDSRCGKEQIAVHEREQLALGFVLIACFHVDEKLI